MPVLGKVGLVNKGAYNSGTSYTALDFVKYNGSTYVALKGVRGITPSNDGTNWSYLAQGVDVAVANSQTVTTPGTALDAVQANRNVSGTLAKDVFDEIGSLHDALANIGRFTESGWKSDVAIPGTGTITEVATISLPAGTYVVFAALSSTGTTKPERAYITYRYGSATTPSVTQNEDFIGRTTLILGYLVVLSNTATVGASCRAWSAVNCSGSIRAVRIK